MKPYITIILITFIALHCHGQASDGVKELPPEVVKTIEARIENDVTPSVALAWIDSSGTYFFNYGKTSHGGTEVDENTVYEIGSISKVFTGILLAQQTLDGDLTLEDRVNDLLPDGTTLAVMGEEEIRLGHLTDHTSGLPRMPDNFAPANPHNPYLDYSVEQMYEFLTSYKPIREVGTEYEYSNLAQGLLGHILAQSKNTTYEELMIETIANPLDMNDTRIQFTDRMKKNLAPGHSGGKVVENWDIPTLAGAGAIRSSSSDMARFISANIGFLPSPLSQAINLSHKIRHDKAGGYRVAMGWHIKQGKNGDVIWHNGGTGGYRAFAGFVKETGQGVVLLTNSSSGLDDIGFHLLDPDSDLADVPFKSDAVKLPPSTLLEYVGVYELQPGFNITITREDDQLYGQATGQNRFELYPENDTTFFLTVVEAKITFQHQDGKTEGLTLLQGGQEVPGKKIE